MSVFSILNHPGSFTVYYYLFDVFYLCKVLFSGFLQFNGNFVDSQNELKIPWWSPFQATRKWLFKSAFLPQNNAGRLSPTKQIRIALALLLILITFLDCTILTICHKTILVRPGAIASTQNTANLLSSWQEWKDHQESPWSTLPRHCPKTVHLAWPVTLQPIVTTVRQGMLRTGPTIRESWTRSRQQIRK